MFSHSSPVALSLQRKVEAEMAGSHGGLPADAMGYSRLSDFNAGTFKPASLPVFVVCLV